MQDKSFLQAIQELQDRMADSFQESIGRMLLYRMTVTSATEDIKDEKVRMVVANVLITGQLVALLRLMRDMRFISEKQCSEFIAYLLASLSNEHGEFTTALLYAFAFLPPKDTLL